MRVVTALLLFLVLFLNRGLSQAPVMKAARVNAAPRIDGQPGDEAWNLADPIILDYVFEPTPGTVPSQSTEVRIVYDNSAFYIRAYCYDSKPDSIWKELTERDAIFKHTDNFYIFLDPYHDGQNAYAFGVSAENVQEDLRCTKGGLNVDNSWNAVWESHTARLNNGWCAEMKIPYSAIRFPRKEIQDWSCDFTRQIRRTRETLCWCHTPPTVEAFIPKMGTLSGISKIEPPLRLSLSPYASEYIYTDANAITSSFKYGADLKYGISESFTLDLTLIPDFGQVASDRIVKNLSPYEVQYQEKRPFFLEGTELFSKNNLFYSRRIGEVTHSYPYTAAVDTHSIHTFQEAPSQSQLINAFKLTGKTRDNLAIGVFNALSNNAYIVGVIDSSAAQQRIIYEPLTNYNIIVLEQTLKNNSHIGFINTSVMRSHHGDYALVSGADFKINDKTNTYALTGDYSESYLFNPNPLPATLSYRSHGSKMHFSAGKAAGSWQYAYHFNGVSKNFNSNDLGYLEKSNYISHYVFARYFRTQPVKKMLRYFGMLETELTSRFQDNRFASLLLVYTHDIDWKNYFTTIPFVAARPVISHDYYDPRVDGRWVNTPASYQCGSYFSTDYRKPFALDWGGDYLWCTEKGRDRVKYFISPRWRLNPKIIFYYTFDHSFSRNQRGYVDNISGTIWFGQRDVKEVSNTFTMQYVLNNRMSFSCTARHYWSGGVYHRYYTLDESGELTEKPYSSNTDFSFNAFNVDMVYRWQFAPGSELSVAWKQVIISEPSKVYFNYSDNISQTFNDPRNNSFSVKMLYYIDYLKLHRH
jgi:hypothetical protein